MERELTMLVLRMLLRVIQNFLVIVKGEIVPFFYLAYIIQVFSLGTSQNFKTWNGEWMNGMGNGEWDARFWGMVLGNDFTELVPLRCSLINVFGKFLSKK